MIFRRPPALANWLLERLGYTRRNVALAGDLLEEFRNGRSAAWYWRQTLAVIAGGIAHNGAVLGPYVLALSAAYAAQLAVTLTLWWKHFPPTVHVAGWGKFGVWLLVQLTYTAYSRWVDRAVVGVPSPNMKQMYCALAAGPPRSKILALAAWQSFSLGLANYSLCALIFLRFSLAGLLGLELTWFVLWIFTPALAMPVALPTAAETWEDYEPWLAIPQSEPILPVVLSNGRTIVLERQSLAQSVFAAADRELMAVVFGRRRSLELLRRAIWLGGYRSNSHIQGMAEAFTLTELDAVIDETARAASVIEACNETNRREGFRQRFRRGFRGDSA